MDRVTFTGHNQDELLSFLGMNIERKYLMEDVHDRCLILKKTPGFHLCIWPGDTVINDNGFRVEPNEDAAKERRLKKIYLYDGELKSLVHSFANDPDEGIEYYKALIEEYEQRIRDFKQTISILT